MTAQGSKGNSETSKHGKTSTAGENAGDSADSSADSSGHSAGATDGLASAAAVEALADRLTACANDLQKRLQQEKARFADKPVPEHQQTLVRALFDDEQVLREQANGLYADAASIVVKSLGQSQQHIIGLTVAAAEKIRKIALLGDVAGVVAAVLGLAGAAATGQPLPIIAALEKLGKQLKSTQSHKKPA